MISFILIAVLAVGMIGGYEFNSKKQTTSGDVRLNSVKYNFINPLIDREESFSQPLMSPEIADLKSTINSITENAIAKKNIFTASIYYRDLNNGPWFTIGENEEFRAASLFKIPLMIAFFKVAETDPSILEKKVTYDHVFENVPDYKVDSSLETVTFGKTYTVGELIDDMIINSDNIAAYLLIANIDIKIIQDVFNDFGFSFENASPERKIVRPKEYASFLRILYNATYLNREYSEKALEILSRSTFKYGMRSVINSDIKASIKYGIAVSPSGEKQLHECGIIYWQPDRPHILCIMTTGSDYINMAGYIKDATSAVQDVILHKNII